jgi:exo-beta-1,3-glucanase (GH17 family)
MRLAHPLALAFALFAAVAAVIAAFWFWMGKPVVVSAASMREPVYCVSFAPFRSHQSPFDLSTRIEPDQVEEDLKKVRELTDCVRTYATDFGSQHVPSIARKLNMKVYLGIWIGDDIMRNSVQVETALSLASRYPDVVRAIIVGNEVLLRRDRSPAELAAYIREVKSRSNVPVTYADVWEFWLRNRELADLVDFITIHTLPYWEDIPIGIAKAAEHIDATLKEVRHAFPGKEILIGEVGWPSAGRMREGALPSLSNQAKLLADMNAIAQKNNYKFNWIEVIDQPWKRKSEGTVGGYWGLIEAGASTPKFVPGLPVSDHPAWKLQLGAGIAFAGLIFLLAGFATQGRSVEPAQLWPGIALIAASGGSLIGLSAEKLVLESITPRDWLFGGARLATMVAIVLAGTWAVAQRQPAARLAGLFAQAGSGMTLPRLLDGLLLALAFFTVQSALGLALDARYRDFPAATLTMGFVPFLVLAWQNRGVPAFRIGHRGLAMGLAFAALWIMTAEGVQNWQAWWFAACLGGLAAALSVGTKNGEMQQQ